MIQLQLYDKYILYKDYILASDFFQGFFYVFSYNLIYHFQKQ